MSSFFFLTQRPAFCTVLLYIIAFICSFVIRTIITIFLLHRMKERLKKTCVSFRQKLNFLFSSVFLDMRLIFKKYNGFKISSPSLTELDRNYWGGRQKNIVYKLNI